MDEGEKIPTELRKEAARLKNELDLDGVPNVDKFLDDEYAKAGVEDPKVILTTSRDPSTRLTQFLKEMRLVFPGAERVNRGNMDQDALVEACRAANITDLIILTETKGNPDGMIISHFPSGPTAYFNLSNTILRHDLPECSSMSEANPHLVFHEFTSKLGSRILSILKYLFPVPKVDSKRVISFVNRDDVISFRHHTYTKDRQANDIILHEVGPRFEMKPFKIKQGTIESKTADTEWVLRPYMNTAKKRKYLAAST